MTWSRICLAISDRTYRGLKANIASGCVALGFMQWFVDKTGDYSPDVSRILMPSCLSIKDLYQEYREANTRDTILLSHYYKIWNSNFAHVSFPKTESSGTKERTSLQATVSKIHAQKLKKLKGNLNDLGSDFEEESSHDSEKERAAYYKRRIESEQNPEEILSVILDGMDQKKGDLPHFKGHADPKGIGQFKLKTHIAGALSHSNNMLYSLIDLGQYSHDTNLTLTCLLHVLSKEAKDGRLPSTLYIQLDNCGRENKNKYFIGFMAYLVKKKYFKEITMSFLMVEHTHEDIDQLFSKYAQKLKPEDAKTLGELISLLERSMVPRPVFIILQTVWNIRDWIVPCLEEIHNQSFPHVYRFFLETSGDVSVQFKNWSTDPSWKPETGKLDIFKRQNGFRVIPVGQPDMVPMTFAEEDTKAVKHSIAKSKDVLSFAQFRWWQTLLDNPEDSVKAHSDQCVHWCLNNLTMYRDVTPPEQSTSELTTETLARLLNKEREGRDVINKVTRPTVARQARLMTGPIQPRPARILTVPVQPRKAAQPVLQIVPGNMAIFSQDDNTYIGKIVDCSNGRITLELFRDIGSGVYRHVTKRLH